MEYIIYIVLGLLIALYFYLRKTTIAIAGMQVGSFSGGRGGRLAATTHELQLIQIKKYSRQQAWSYALLWISIFGSLILGGILIYKNFVLKNGDQTWLPELIGLAGGGGVSLTSFSLYRSSSKKIDSLLEKVTL